MTFDKKEQKILEHYKTLLENSLFDEYDILAFLIFLRRHLDKNRYPYLHDFADLIAHRGRDRGIAMDAIRGAIQNGYTLVQGQKKIEGYHGIDQKKWKQEWIGLASKFGFTINEKIIAEATMCIFSLAQFTTYSDGQYQAKQDQRHLSKSEFEMVLFCSGCVRRPVEDTVLWNLQLECLRKAVDGLGDQGRDLVELRYGQGLTMEEIGTIYGVSKAAVSKRLKKLHEQLRGSVI